MSWKNLTQYGFADAALSSHESLKELDDVHHIIDWSEIESLLSSLYASKRGKPAFPPIMMFKVMLLQAWYNLSDPAMEKQLTRDLLFRRFVGLSLSESTRTVRTHKTLNRLCMPITPMPVRRMKNDWARKAGYCIERIEMYR